MSLDPSRLRRDVEARKANPRLGPGGRPRTGAMAAVRQHLGEIEALHAEGASWVDIAAGLTAQGIVQGDGAPLTGRRLTALIASIKRQDVRRAVGSARRAERPDLRHEAPPPSSADRQPLVLAPELRTAATAAAQPVEETEDEIRLQKLRRVEGFFKPDLTNGDR